MFLESLKSLGNILSGIDWKHFYDRKNMSAKTLGRELMSLHNWSKIHDFGTTVFSVITAKYYNGGLREDSCCDRRSFMTAISGLNTACVYQLSVF